MVLAPESAMWKPGSYRADREHRLRRWFCPVCKTGVVLAVWVHDAYCGWVENAERVPVGLYGTGGVAHKLTRCVPLDLDHGQDPQEQPRL